MSNDIQAWYRANSAKGKLVMAEKKAQGERMHKAPYGFKNVRDDLGRSTIAPDPQAFPLLIEAHRLRKDGLSYRAISKALWIEGTESSSG